MGELPPIVPHTPESRRKTLIRYVGTWAVTWLIILVLIWFHHH